MSEPFIGEIRIFAGMFAPQGWAFCDGQSMPISQYDTLYALIGTSFGGDGVSTFNLPDFRGRVPLHFGGGIAFGQSGGSDTVTLTPNNIPAHTHDYLASNDTPALTTPAGNVTGQSVNKIYRAGQPGASLHPNSIGAAQGNSLPHQNMQPYLSVTFIIALEGIYPPQG